MKKANKKKELILEHARSCFARYGYDKTTLDDIGRSVGLNKASLYYYYKNKEAIYVQMVLAESSAYMKFLLEQIKWENSVTDKIVAYLLQRIKFHKGVSNLHQLSVQSLLRKESMFKDLYDTIKSREVVLITKLLYYGVEIEEFEEEDMEALAESLFLVSDAIKQDIIRQSDAQFSGEVDYAEAEDKLNFTVRLLLQGITFQ